MKRRRQDAGRATYVAGVQGDRVVATGGIVLCDLGGRTVARYEDVQTLPEHRGNGLAGHVIAAAHAWAIDHGAVSSVLVADADGDAVDLYRRMGFLPGDQAWMVLPRRVRRPGS